jgi:hypothetical protein
MFVKDVSIVAIVVMALANGAFAGDEPPLVPYVVPPYVPTLELPQQPQVELSPTIPLIDPLPIPLEPELAPIPLISVNQSANLEFRLKNESSVMLTLFVDGVRTLTVPAGDTSWDLITPGYHTFRAETLGGSHSVTRKVYISRPVTWTITD